MRACDSKYILFLKTRNRIFPTGIWLYKGEKRLPLYTILSVGDEEHGIAQHANDLLTLTIRELAGPVTAPAILLNMPDTETLLYVSLNQTTVSIVLY